jgi:hypothetical protein
VPQNWPQYRFSFAVNHSLTSFATIIGFIETRRHYPKFSDFIRRISVLDALFPKKIGPGTRRDKAGQGGTTWANFADLRHGCPACLCLAASRLWPVRKDRLRVKQSGSLRGSAVKSCTQASVDCISQFIKFKLSVRPVLFIQAASQLRGNHPPSSPDFQQKTFPISEFVFRAALVCHICLAKTNPTNRPRKTLLAENFALIQVNSLPIEPCGSKEI